VSKGISKADRLVQVETIGHFRFGGAMMVTLVSIVAHFAPEGSTDPAIGPPDLPIRLEQDRIGKVV
jgi:hypothetical protein